MSNELLQAVEAAGGQWLEGGDAWLPDGTFVSSWGVGKVCVGKWGETYSDIQFFGYMSEHDFIEMIGE